jgi:hypothetical protein
MSTIYDENREKSITLVRQDLQHRGDSGAYPREVEAARPGGLEPCDVRSALSRLIESGEAVVGDDFRVRLSEVPSEYAYAD